MLKKSLVIATVVGIAVTGCGKSNDQSNSSEKQAESQSSAAQCPLYANLMKSERNRNYGDITYRDRDCSSLTQNTEKPNVQAPDSAYTEINNGNQILWAYYAAKPGNVEYSKIAEVISQKYQDSNDAFKKQEIIEQLKPEIDNKIAAAKSNKYYYVDMSITLNPYDFNTHSFELYSDALSGWSYNYTPHVKYLNSNAFANLKIDDVETAKKIENLRASRKLKGYIFLHMNNVSLAQESNASRDVIFASITKIEYKDPAGNLIYTQYAN